MSALLGAIQRDPDAPARVVLCISNNPNPGAFDVARDDSIPTFSITPRSFEREEDYAALLLERLMLAEVEMIVLAGYMRKLPPSVVERYRGRIVNVHPALLPKHGGRGMYGMAVHEAVLAAGEEETGVTVHLVDEEYDTGPILAQERIAVEPGETPESLAARVLAVEHHLLPHVVFDLARRIRENDGE